MLSVIVNVHVATPAQYLSVSATSAFTVYVPAFVGNSAVKTSLPSGAYVYVTAPLPSFPSNTGCDAVPLKSQSDILTARLLNILFVAMVKILLLHPV